MAVERLERFEGMLNGARESKKCDDLVGAGNSAEASRERVDKKG
jgi:hypothetical protein